jgi:DNA-binding MarR family transcriptional regulator
MDELFNAEPTRMKARRGIRTPRSRRPRRDDVWPRPDRDPDDIALVAAQLLVASGRLVTRLRRIARRHGVDPQLVRLLLLFADSNRSLRIGNVAELLGVSETTASRIATNAQMAGLVDKCETPHDRREVTIRITPTGRIAVANCLDALRAPAASVLGIGTSKNAHPRGKELIDLLGAPPHLARASEHSGWRAGVRIGMWPPI